jgi:hypothetical protein
MNHAAATSASVAANWIAKVRAAFVHALNLHLQTCAIVAEAHRRPQ